MNEESKPTSNNSEQSRKVLIVEDEPQMQSMLQMRLESAGYQVVIANNGQEGLEKVKQECPHLIISDVLMPVMDGFAFYKELKNSKVTADIPVLILTARGKMEDSFKVMGVDDFIVKPFQGEDLLEKIKALLGRAGSLQPISQESAKRVLVAGDSTDVIENMVLQLKKMGCVTDLVTTGPQIISKVVLFLPQVLVMEVQMEDMPSSEVIKVIRQMPQTEKIPILVYSYYRVEELGSEDVRQKALSVSTAQDNCMDAGATEYIGRFNENTFAESVRKHLV